MGTLIALFRGINVGGRNSLKMAELKDLLGMLGYEGVQTYIQSGNAVFRAGSGDPLAVAERIEAGVAERHGFAARVLVFDAGRLSRAIASNPFPDAVDPPTRLHLFFLAGPPAESASARLDTLRATSERWEVVDHTFYLDAPDGIGRSKLAAGAERALGVAATGRNWRTVQAIAQMAARGP